MSVAQVLNTSGANPTDTPPPEATKMAEGIKAMEGCEHIYALGNSTGGPGISILIWRDKDCMEAAAAQMASDEAQLGGMGITVTHAEVYDTFTEL
jgi:hypothetical protein